MSVKKFLAAAKPTWRGGPPCQTCRHPKKRAIDEACRVFVAQRRAQKTFMPWRTFVARYVRPKMNYQFDYRCLVRHVEACLGEETK